MLAKDLMNSKVATLDPEMTLREMAVFLDDEKIHGAPVIDGAGHLVGVASHTDLVRAISTSEEEGSTSGGSYFTFGGAASGIRSGSYVAGSSVADEMTVSDIMSRDVVTATEDATVGELAELMLSENVLRIVITQGEKLLGVISATDLLRVIVKWQGERQKSR